jgi:hypothetical protein
MTVPVLLIAVADLEQRGRCQCHAIDVVGMTGRCRPAQVAISPWSDQMIAGTGILRWE